MKPFYLPQGAASIRDRHATNGTKSLRIACAPAGYLVQVANLDWSGSDSLDVEVFDGTDTITALVLVGDEACHQKGGSYEDRHNRPTRKPGNNTCSIPVNGRFPCEPGSHDDLHRSSAQALGSVSVHYAWKPASGFCS